jgi:hypothetical protein
MKYFYIEPEVAGGLGKNTVINRSVHPPTISKLHYHFDGWIGDALLESFPSFIVTKDVERRLQSIGATGARFDDVEVTVSDQFKELYQDRHLPHFVWLRVEGQPGREDLGTTLDGRLVASERALEVFREFGVANSLVTPFIN